MPGVIQALSGKLVTLDGRDVDIGSKCYGSWRSLWLWSILNPLRAGSWGGIED
jgi:hypothetical protein